MAKTRDTSYIGKTAYCGDVAANYERDRTVEPLWLQEQAWVAEWVRQVPAGSRLLDLPAGTGRFLEIWLAHDFRVHAVDISADMLAELRQRLPANAAGLVIECADAEALPYAAATFDFVVCWRLLHLLPRPAAVRVLRELGRVCHGTIVVEVLNVAPGGEIRRLLREAKHTVRQIFRGKTPARVTTPWGHITSYPQTELGLQQLFTRSGLRVIQAETLAIDGGVRTRVYHLQSGGSW